MSEARRLALSDPGSEAYKMALKMVKQIVGKASRSSCGVGSVVKVNLDSALSYDHLAFLREEFGYEYNSQPQGTPLQFPFLSAYSKSVARSLEGQKSWKGEETVYINGDVRQLVVRGFNGLKIVRYYGDPSVHSFFFDEDAFIKRTLDSRHARMKEHAIRLMDQLEDGDGPYFSKKGALSRIQGDTVYFDPMRIRCSLQDVASEIVRRGAQRAKGWIPFSPDVLRASSGSLYGGRVSFIVDLNESKVVFFEKGVVAAAFSYRLADYYSYLTRDPFVCDGAGFVMEIHGSPEGRLDWILSRVDAADIGKVEVEKVPVWSKSFSNPGLLVSLKVRLDTSSALARRVVLRDDPDLFSRAVGSLVGGSSPITMKTAIAARAMYRDQVMLPSGGVVLPKSADGLVEHLLARAVYRRATFAKAAMVIAEAANKESIRMSVELKDSLAKAVCSIMWTTGKDMISAVRAPFDELETAKLDDTWDVAVVEETPKMWLDGCWLGVVSSMGSSVYRDPAYWPTGVDRNVWERTSAVITGGIVESSVVDFFSDDRSGSYARIPVMGKEREEAARKIIELTGAERGPSVAEVVKRVVVVNKPVMSPPLLVDNPVEVMKEEFDREFPGLSLIDMEVRPYLIMDSDKNISPNAPLMKVPLVDKPVPRSEFLTTGFNVGVSGPRPRSVNEVISAFVSRVAGAPTYEWDIDLESSLSVEFDRFAEVFLRPGWEQDVKRRIGVGYMYPTENDIYKVVGKMSPSNVSKVLREDFKAEGVLMTVLKAMVKRTPKDRQSISVAFEHKPNQTIMYQDSKITNAYFSAALGKFHDCLDTNLKDGMLINPRIDKEKVEEIWNSVKFNCVPDEGEISKLVDLDISQCDKSQTVANMLRYMYLMCRFGFGDFTQLWSKMIELKRAGDPSSSVLVEFFAQVISGYFNTISANSCIVAWGSANSINVPANCVRRAVVSGDDVVMLLVGNMSINLEAISHSFVTRYNFDVKVFESDNVLYWCGRLGVEIGGYTHFVKDLGRIRSSFFKAQGRDYNAEEAWESFLDDTKGYDNEELVVGVAEAYAKRMGMSFIPIGTARAIATIRRNKSLFVNRFVGKRILG